MPTLNRPWAIILCKFNDKPAETQPANFYEELFTQNGTGGICDYYRAATCNAVDLSASQVFGWYTMNKASTDADRLTYPGDRNKLVQWGIDAAVSHGVNLAPFQNRILVIQNYGKDHGAAGNGVNIIHQSNTLIEFGFICHEMGHGLGLGHSFSANPDFEYGDGWDVMSWQTTQFTYNYVFRGSSGLATVGLNAPNIEKLGAMPPRRVWARPNSNFSEQIVLDPIGQSALGNHGYLMVKILPQSTSPIRPDGSSYTVEFRRKAGWDQAIPRDAVLIHQIRTNGNAYIQPARWKDFIT